MGVVEICLIVSLVGITSFAVWRFSSRVQRQDLGVTFINESIYETLRTKMVLSLNVLAPVAAESALYAYVKDLLAQATNVDDLNAAAIALKHLEDEFKEQSVLHQSRNAKSEALNDLGSRLLPRKD